MRINFFEMSKIQTLFIVVLLVVSCDPEKKEIRPIINEGIYINEIYASGEDWIELYNELTVSKNISGYFIYDNATTKYQIPLNTVISAKGFLVFICNDLGSGLNTNFKLSSQGEVVYLEDKTGVLLDRVEYPALSSGQSYGRYGDGSANLAISGVATKGTSNGDSQAPAISTVVRAPLIPSLNQNVTITATLISNVAVASTKLYYRFNGGSYTSSIMTLVGSNYVATIPGSVVTGSFEYYVEVKGSNGKMSYEPATAPTKTLSYLLNTDLLPNLVVNEFLAFNSSCCPDVDSGIQEFDDWIEIYNRGNTAVNLAGMYLSDDKTNPFKSKIPTDNATATTILPGGYLLLWADNTPAQGPLHLNFGLSNLGEDVGLFYLDGRTIDAFTFGAQSENISFGRVTDGASTWKIFNTPSPGKTN